MRPLPRRVRPALVFVAGATLLVGTLLWFSPMWSGPHMPDGATRLHLRTAPASLIPTLGCPTALLQPAMLVVASDELVLAWLPYPNRGPHQFLGVVFPAGWAAWTIDGRAVLVDWRGTVVGREGDILTDLGGGLGSDGAFHVCVTSL